MLAGTAPQGAVFAGTKEKKPVRLLRDVHYPGGLVVKIPVSSYRISAAVRGFRVLPGNAEELRAPWTLDVRYQTGAAPDARGMSERSIGGREVRFRVDKGEVGGSGGEVHTLTAVLPCGGGYIVFTETWQSEYPEEPEFAAIWEVIAHTGCQGLPEREG